MGQRQHSPDSSGIGLVESAVAVVLTLSLASVIIFYFVEAFQSAAIGNTPGLQAAQAASFPGQ